MAIYFKTLVKPSDMQTGLLGSNFQKREKELIAGDIIVISQKNGDTWFDFSFDDYRKYCGHIVTEKEHSVLNALAMDDEVLDLKGERYSVNENFFRTLAKFIN